MPNNCYTEYVPDAIKLGRDNVRFHTKVGPDSFRMNIVVRRNFDGRLFGHFTAFNDDGAKTVRASFCDLDYFNSVPATTILGY